MDDKPKFPKVVPAHEVVNCYFGKDLFQVKGGRAKYDEVWMADGGEALYLVRLIPPAGDNSTPDTSPKALFRIYKRWIPWTTILLMLYQP